MRTRQRMLKSAAELGDCNEELEQAEKCMLPECRKCGEPGKEKASLYVLVYGSKLSFVNTGFLIIFKYSYLMDNFFLINFGYKT